MTEIRYSLLMSDDKESLTENEWKEGWHFCHSEWDGLLVGPGMVEYDICTCKDKLKTDAPKDKPLHEKANIFTYKFPTDFVPDEEFPYSDNLP